MIRIGLIGCGYIANKHIETLAKFNEIELVAVSDLEKNNMEKAAALYREKQRDDHQPILFYEDYQDMLRNSEIDAVIISVISSLHAEIAKQALLLGKHIIVEKPLALSIQDANAIINLSEKLNQAVLVCHQLRYRPLIQKIKQLISEGYFGKLYFGVATMRLHRSSDYYTSASWRGTWEKDGGMLINQGIHLVDLLIWMMGNVKSVYGEIATFVPNKEIEDVATGIISFDNLAKGLIEANIITKPSNLGYELALFGEKGSICIGGQSLNLVKHCFVEQHPHLEKMLIEQSKWLNEHELMYRNFIEVMKDKQQTVMNAKEGKKALETIFALYQSDRENSPILLPLESFSTKDMHELKGRRGNDGD